MWEIITREIPYPDLTPIQVIGLGLFLYFEKKFKKPMEKHTEKPMEKLIEKLIEKPVESKKPKATKKN